MLLLLYSKQSQKVYRYTPPLLRAVYCHNSTRHGWGEWKRRPKYCGRSLSLKSVHGNLNPTYNLIKPSRFWAQIKSDATVTTWDNSCFPGLGSALGCSSIRTASARPRGLGIPHPNPSRHSQHPGPSLHSLKTGARLAYSWVGL